MIKARFEFDSQLYDPLSITSLYGSDAMLCKLLEDSNFDNDSYLPTPAIAAADEILQWRNLSRLRALFLDTKFAHQLHNLDFFRLIIQRWSEVGVRHDNWTAAFDLVEIVLNMLVGEQWGADLLCMAARAGCMPIIQRLLNGTQHKSKLRTELLRGSQSIAQAVLGDHADVVECLLDQEGFGAHLEYVNSHSEHILHLASETCDPAIFRLLAPRLQGRIHQTDRQPGAHSPSADHREPCYATESTRIREDSTAFTSQQQQWRGSFGRQRGQPVKTGCTAGRCR